MSGTGKYQTSGILGIENAQPHVIYDLSLPLSERREKAIVFRSASYLGRHFGCKASTIISYREPGRRYKDKNGKLWAIRLCPKNMLHKLK